MANTSFKICVVCCYSYRVEGDGLKNVKQSECSNILLRFCKELTEGDGAVSSIKIDGQYLKVTRKRRRKDNANYGDDKAKVRRGGSYSNKKAQPTLPKPDEKSSENLSVCSDCLSLLVKVSEARAKAGKGEVRVRKLQQRILTELKELKEEMGHVYLGIKRVEEVMSNADGGCLQSLADDGRDTQVNEIIAFRESILSVSRSLHSYQAELAAKLLTSSQSDSKSGKSNVIKMEPMEVDNHADLRHLLPSQTNFQELIKQEGSDARTTEVNEDVFFPQPSSSATVTACENDNETDPLEINSPPSSPPEPWNPLNYDDDASGEDGNRTSNEAWLQPRRMYTDLCTLVEPTRKKSKTKILAKTKAAPKRRRKRKSITLHKPKKVVRSVLPPDVITTGMSSWRMELLKRVYRRLNKYAGEAGTSEYADEDNFVKNFPMKYHPSTGFLSIADVEDLVINDEEKCLQCSKCSYRATDGKHKLSDPADMKLFSHVLGTHMDAFNCKYCGQKFTVMKNYNMHLKVHTNPDLFKCDKCGKQVMSFESLKSHQWVHMTPEEKAEAIQAGKLKEKWYKDPNRKYQCPTCGKSFGTKSNLNTHEKAVHSGRRDITCFRCGKAFALQSSYWSHIRNSCLDDDHPKLECDICNAADPDPKTKKLYKNAGTLQEHIKRTHSKDGMEKNFVCEICSKRFSAKEPLRRHLKKHLDLPRNLLCKIGCGATFGRGYHLKRHESRCTGPGYRVRIRTDRLNQRTSEEAKRKIMNLIPKVKAEGLECS